MKDRFSCPPLTSCLMTWVLLLGSPSSIYVRDFTKFLWRKKIYLKWRFTPIMATMNSRSCCSSCAMHHRPSQPQWKMFYHHFSINSLWSSLKISLCIVRHSHHTSCTWNQSFPHYYMDSSCCASLSVFSPKPNCSISDTLYLSRVSRRTLLKSRSWWIGLPLLLLLL